MKITIEQRGSNWVASDGETSIESFEPVVALAELIDAKCMREVDPQVLDDMVRDEELRRPVEECSRQVDRFVIALIKLMTLGAPDVLIDSEVGRINATVADWKAARAVAKESAPT